MSFPKATIPVNPFTIDHSQQEIDDMKTLLRLSPLGPDTYENSSVHNHKFGPSKAWMEDMKRSWLEFDWPVAQTKLNEFPQFIADVEDVDPLTGRKEVFQVHFVGIENKDPDAIPVIIMHGWPGNFNEILPLIPYLLTTPNPPMHIIVPSQVQPASLHTHLPLEANTSLPTSLTTA
jgi:microsomal epoxide hydrolase